MVQDSGAAESEITLEQAAEIQWESKSARHGSRCLLPCPTVSGTERSEHSGKKSGTAEDDHRTFVSCEEAEVRFFCAKLCGKCEKTLQRKEFAQ